MKKIENEIVKQDLISKNLIKVSLHSILKLDLILLLLITGVVGM
jgi:hypothetical protein